MSKLQITEDIEYALFDYFHVQKSTRCALEVDISVGRVDLLAMSKKDEITCVEIKVTKQDFKSISGHNLIGNKNYYAMPEELYKEVAELIPKHVGVIAARVSRYGSSECKIIKNAKKIDHKYPKQFLNRIRENMWVALNSNLRRLLRYRSLKNVGRFEGL